MLSPGFQYKHLQHENTGNYE